MSEPAPHRPTGVLPERGSAATPIPRWVKGFVIILILLLVAFVVLHLTGNGMGGHG